MKLSIVTAVCGANQITKQWLHETVGRCAVAPDLEIVANGSTKAEIKELMDEAGAVYARWNGQGGDWAIHDLKTPQGSTKPLNRGIRYATGDVVACLHNDLMVRDPGWDTKVLSVFEAPMTPPVGVVGFHGSTMLGADEIYRVPYQLPQLARGGSVSNMEDAESHGGRVTYPVPVVTLDGMALIARRSDLTKWGGFDERYLHHMYDHDLCLTARQHGHQNWMLPILVRHISGQTANAARYNDHLAKIGRGNDANIHGEAHAAFYEKWRGTGQLPARI